MADKEDARILTYESSCNKTSTAVIRNGREVESLVVATQMKSHQRFDGVVPEIASWHHIGVITQITKEALSGAKITWDDIDAAAVTYGPGLVGALLVSVSAAKAANMTIGIPLIGVDHIMSHIMAAQLEDKTEYPALALQVFGEHTELVLMHDPINFEIIGDARDDAAGEAYDKIGRVLGVSYPVRKTTDTWAHQGSDTFSFSRAMFEDDDYDFSFSGLKSAFINTCHHTDQTGEKLGEYDLTVSFQAAVVNVLSRKTIRTIKEFKPKTFVLDGGVTTNRGLCGRLEAEIGKLDTKPKVIIPPMKLCGDNAAMIGVAAYNLCKTGKSSGLDLNADPSLESPYADVILDR